MDPGLVRALQNGFRVRGIELLSYNGGMTSAAGLDATTRAGMLDVGDNHFVRAHEGADISELRA